MGNGDHGDHGAHVTDHVEEADNPGEGIVIVHLQQMGDARVMGEGQTSEDATHIVVVS